MSNTDWIIRIVAAPQCTQNDEHQQFGQQRIYWVDDAGQKNEHLFWKMSEGGKYFELIMCQLSLFKEVADGAQWFDVKRFSNWKRCLGGELLEEWDALMDEGHDDLWDPANMNNAQDFDDAIKAWLYKITDVIRTANVQQKSVMDAGYQKHGKKDGKWMKPSAFYKRKLVIWKYSENMNRVGLPVNDQSRLEAEHDGFSQEMREWLEHHAGGVGYDIFDSENGGADMWTPRDLYDKMDQYWLLNLKNKDPNGGGRGKRGRGDDDGGNGNNNNNNNGQRKRQKPNYHGNNNNNNRNNNNRNNNNNNNNSQHQGHGAKECPFHGHHKWGDCRLNIKNKKTYDKGQADNFYRRNSGNPEMRAKGEWWFRGYENKNNISNGGQQQQQYFGGQPYQQNNYQQNHHQQNHHQQNQQQQNQQQPNGSYFQAPGGAPPNFVGGQSTASAPQVSSYATLGSSSGPPRPITRTQVWNEQTRQWIEPQQYTDTSEALTGYANAPAALAYHQTFALDVLPSQTTYHSVSSCPQVTGNPNADAHYTTSSPNYSAGHADVESDAPPSHCFQSEAVPIVDPISTADGPQWHLREEDYSSLFEEMLAPDPVETLIGDIPSVQLQASIDRTVCNNSYYADNPLVPHSNFEDWDCFQYHNTSVEFSDPSIHWLGELYPPTQPTETPLETEIVNVEVSFTVDDKGVTVPMATGFVLVKAINGKPTARLLKCLFDTGGTKTMASSKILPMGATITPIEGATMCNTIAGNYHPMGKLTCEGLRFPEFDRNLVVDEVECLVFDAPCSYDLILGMDFLVKAGMVINCGSMTVEWQGKTIPMNSSFTKERLAACVDMNYFSDEEDDGIFDSYATSLAESTYERMDVDAVIKENCSHLTESQQKDLRELFIKHERLFDGTLRTYTDKKMDVELLPEASA
eukprot:scaffold20538_cov78-Skeletonema_dohrnii-CCMP3373.AAC.1